MRSRLAVAALAVGPALAGLTAAGVARADDLALERSGAAGVASDPAREREIVAAVNADEKPASPSVVAKPEEEAPPLPPRHKGVVLESSLGGLVFLGRFRQIAPPAVWLHAQVGYEFFSWLMVFGEGELAFTDTSVADDGSRVRAFPLFGFGGGLRATVHATERVAIYAQGSLGGMKADIANGALALEGYRDAESLALMLGGRLGVEWYQVDRHLALGLAVGIRDAKGFARTTEGGDTPLMLDASGGLRYTF
jgi:hypothetical protein